MILCKHLLEMEQKVLTTKEEGPERLRQDFVYQYLQNGHGDMELIDSGSYYDMQFVIC